MKNRKTFLAAVLGMCAMGVAARAGGAPTIQFDRTLYNFGQTSNVATVSGVFKFKNTGDAVLKLEPPKPSCGCTVAELKPDTLPPGATGELPFTMNLGFARATLEKHIVVRSNDPKTPEVSLTIKVDYTPLYDLNPMTLSPSLAFGTNDAAQFTSLTRTDGKPVRIVRLEASQPWIKATVEPGGKTGESAARIRVAIQREGPPRRFNEYVRLYAADQTNTPVSTVYLYGQVMGEVSLSPEALYWSITGAAPPPGEGREAQITRRVTIRSATGRAFELKNPRSTIQGLKLEVVPKEAGVVYELIARLDNAPAATVSGSVSFETSVPAQPRMEVPVIVNVFKQ